MPPTPWCSSHFVRPSATVGPCASASTSSSTAVVELGRGHRRGGSRPTRAASAPESLRPSSSSSRARTSPTRRGSNHVAPLSGVKPRSVNGSQNVASSAAIGEVGRERELEPDARGPAANRADDRDLHRRRAAGSAGGPGSGAGAGCCRRGAGRRRSRVARDDVGATAEVITAAPRARSRARARRSSAAVSAGDRARPSSRR